MDAVEGMLGAVRMVDQYLEDGPRANLTGRYLSRACRLLGVHGEKGQWSLDARNAGERLQLAGLDPQTLEVADEVRWSHALDYMRACETFKVDGFKRWLEEHPEPSSVPAQDVPARPHPRARNKQKENPSNRVINGRIQGCVG